MKPRKFQHLKQPTSKELRDACLNFLRAKFYGTSSAEVKAFAQDRSRLLKWVVLWPATWLNNRAVTIHGDAYREIFFNVFFQAAAHMESKVKYRPAYLRQVIQSHFKIHGEEYYEEAKATRNQVDHVMMMAGQLARQAAPAADPVREMANARQILASGARKKSVEKTPVKAQLNLFG